MLKLGHHSSGVKDKEEKKTKGAVFNSMKCTSHITLMNEIKAETESIAFKSLQ